MVLMVVGVITLILSPDHHYNSMRSDTTMESRSNASASSAKFAAEPEVPIGVMMQKGDESNAGLTPLPACQFQWSRITATTVELEAWS